VAYELHNGRAFPGVAASAVPAFAIVRMASGANAPQRGVVPIATTTEPGFGMTGQAGASRPGLGVTVYERGNHCKAIAGASLGVGAPVSIASGQPNRLAPVTAASGFPVIAIGEATTPANPGEFFTVHVDPRAV
jgi:hypothetical protein